MDGDGCARVCVRTDAGPDKFPNYIELEYAID